MAYFVVYFVYSIKAVNWHSRVRSYFKLLFAAILEPFIYHPLITYCSNVGYWRFLSNTRAVWKPIARRGVKKKKK